MAEFSTFRLDMDVGTSILMRDIVDGYCGGLLLSSKVVLAISGPALSAHPGPALKSRA